MTVVIILVIINLVYIANEFYPNIKPSITDDRDLVEYNPNAPYKKPAFAIPGFRSIDFEGYTALAVYLIAPILILYFILKDYFISIVQKQKLNFLNTFKKGAISSFIIGAIIGITTLMTCGGEECIGILAAFIIVLGGIIFTLIITTILYFRSKNKFDSVS